MADAAVLANLLDATREGRPHAVIDPSWPQALHRAASEQVAAAVAAGRVRGTDLVVFTSGSTGRPRGVVRSITSWEASASPLSAVAGIGPGDVVWVPGPLTSSLFLYGAWHAVRAGAMPVLGQRSPRAATVLHAVPAVLADALDAAEAGLLPRMRVAVVAGDVLRPASRQRAAALGWRLVEYYGAAELSFVGVREDEGAFLPFPGADVAVRGGLLWARSPYLARGYLDPGDGGPLRRDGEWATVGDVAEEAGRGFRLRGRGTAAVTTGGSTVVVEEVQQFLREQPGVRDVAVFGVPHERLGQVVAAVVVPLPGARWQDLRARLADAVRALPPPARPRRWASTDVLPHTAAGKVDRTALERHLR